MAYILTVDFVSVNGAVSYEKRWYEPTAYITPEEYQQLAEEFIGARPVKNKEDETNGKDP